MEHYFLFVTELIPRETSWKVLTQNSFVSLKCQVYEHLSTLICKIQGHIHTKKKILHTKYIICTEICTSLSKVVSSSLGLSYPLSSQCSVANFVHFKPNKTLKSCYFGQTGGRVGNTWLLEFKRLVKLRASSKSYFT